MRSFGPAGPALSLRGWPPHYGTPKRTLKREFAGAGGSPGSPLKKPTRSHGVQPTGYSLRPTGQSPLPRGQAFWHNGLRPVRRPWAVGCSSRPGQRASSRTGFLHQQTDSFNGLLANLTRTHSWGVWTLRRAARAARSPDCCSPAAGGGAVGWIMKRRETEARSCLARTSVLATQA